MTCRQVHRLWWSQSWRWVIGLMAVLIVIGMGAAVKTTQGHQQGLQQTSQMKAYQASDYRKHPENYQLHGHQVSLAEYNTEQYQLFSKDQFKVHGYETRIGVAGNNWYYLFMMIAGLVLAFWGRRTHYAEFMMGLGATRNQLFLVQLGQALALTLTVAVAQLSYWGWVIAVIPAKYQVYRNLAGLFGSNVAIVTISFGVLVLGWFIGLLNNRFWLAAILSGLSWRFLEGVGSESGYAMLLFGDNVLPVGFWFYAHYYVASSLVLGLSILACGAIWQLQRTWSAELTPFGGETLFRKVGLIGVVTIAGGAILGDIFLQPFIPGVLPWFEILGMAILLVVLLLGLTIQKQRLKGVQHGA